MSSYMGTISSAASESMATFGEAYAQEKALKAQGAYTRQMFETNSRLATMDAEDAIRRGDNAAASHEADTDRLIGAQRARLAAQGQDLESGSALDIQLDTAELGAQDALTIRNNAWREAWGYRVAASDMGYKGRFAMLAANNAAVNTILTSGMDIIRIQGEAGNSISSMAGKGGGKGAKGAKVGK